MYSGHASLAEEQEVFTRVEFEPVCKIDVFHQHSHLDVDDDGYQERWWNIDDDKTAKDNADNADLKEWNLLGA